MKFKYLFYICLIILLCKCENDFEAINTDPVNQTSLDSKYLFAQAQLQTARGYRHYQLPIVQQVIHPYTGTPSGGNHNVENNNAEAALFTGFYSGPVKYLTEVINETNDIPERSNLHNMARIWRAYVFQILVDTYGYIPYTEAGIARLDDITRPKYDSGESIYEDIYNELVEATNSLDNSKPMENNDLFYDGNVSQWIKLGNSLLLRVAMRYTKIDLNKAEEGAKIAFNNGLISSNSDNAGIDFNSTQTNEVVEFVYSQLANIYLGKPFVDYLQKTNDPRLNVIAVKYENPANVQDPGKADTNPDHQQGMPFGYDDATISTAPNFPGRIGTAWKYSQINRSTKAKIDAPFYFVTYSETQLLLAEAAYRGWIPGDPQDYYEEGVRANMNEMKLYDESATIPDSSQEAYLQANPFDPAKAMEQINTQYWITTFLDGPECWANFRRSGFPDLAPNPYPGANPAVKGGFIHRLTYPAREYSVNSDNLNDAISRMGPDNLATRVFWDENK